MLHNLYLNCDFPPAARFTFFLRGTDGYLPRIISDGNLSVTRKDDGMALDKESPVHS